VQTPSEQVAGRPTGSGDYRDCLKRPLGVLVGDLEHLIAEEHHQHKGQKAGEPWSN
jgi:hypothetical protein